MIRLPACSGALNNPVFSVIGALAHHACVVGIGGPIPQSPPCNAPSVDAGPVPEPGE